MRALVTPEQDKNAQPRGLARSDETSNFKPNEHALRGDAQGTRVVPGVSFCTHIFGNGFGWHRRRARVKGARPLYCCPRSEKEATHAEETDFGR